MANPQKRIYTEAETDQMISLYLQGRKSIPDIAVTLSLPRSAVRTALLNVGVQLRSRAEGVRNARPKLGSGFRGKTRVFTEEHCEAMSKARLEKLDFDGYRVTSQGYLAFTRGSSEGILVHRHLGEMLIGRKLADNEVVHHIDHDRGNNDLDNLQVMTAEEHAKLHANEAERERDSEGKFTGEKMPVNKAIILGRIGQNLELKYTPTGEAVTNFSVATNESWVGKDGQKQERVEWHRIVAWSKLAEVCAKYLSKGKQIYLEGKIQTRQWQDKDGQTKYMTEIVAQNVQFLDNGGQKNESTAAGPATAAPSEPSFTDDVPF